MKKWILIILVAIITGVFVTGYINKRYPKIDSDINLNNDSSPVVESKKLDNPKAATSTSTLSAVPSTLLLKVPFTPQAPTANWDELHNEACEEAAAIMAAEYFKGNTQANLPPELVEEQITSLTRWQDKNFGYHLDTTAQETATMIEQVYGLKTKLLENFSAEDIQTALGAGKLALISENGRLLGNPYYKSPGPIHHMLLIKGYNSAGFVTNDSGTKRGFNYSYNFNTLQASAADWDHDQNTVNLNKKVVIFVWK